MSTSRAEAFSDGVLAVAITLLALDLRVPDPAGAGTLSHRLGEQWPSYAAYVVSFLTIGIIWINHHASLRRLVAIDHVALVLNVLLLMAVVVLPFTTSLLAAYLRAPRGDNFAALVYGASLLAMALAFFSFHAYVLSRPALLGGHMTPPVRRAVLLRNAAGLVPYAVATAAAIVSPYATLAISGAVAVYYALPLQAGDSA